MPATIRSASEIGRVTKTVGSPCEMISARRRCCSSSGAEDEPEQKRGRLAAQLDQRVAEQPKQRDREHIERILKLIENVPMQANAMIAGKRTRYGTVSRRTQMPISGRFSRTSSRLPIHIDTIEAPEQGRLFVDDVRPGRDPLDDEGADHQRHDRVRRQSQRQERDEGCLRRRVVRGLRARDALDRAVPKRLRVLRDPLFERVGGERRRARARRPEGPPARIRGRCPGGWAGRSAGGPRGSATGP